MLNRLEDFLTAPKNAISFEPISLSIITADYFSFNEITKQLAAFCSQHIEKLLEIISEKWDDEALENFASLLPLETLETTYQKDQVKAQLLYKARTSFILSVDDIHRCKYANCRKLFTVQQHQLLKMQQAKCFHRRDENFNGNEFVANLSSKFDWRDTFWLIWSETKMFKCVKCLQFFKLSELDDCIYGTHVFHETVPKEIIDWKDFAKSKSNLSNEFVEIIQDQSTLEDDLKAEQERYVRPGRAVTQPAFNTTKNAELWRMDRIREFDIKHMKELEENLKKQRSVKTTVQ